VDWSRVTQWAATILSKQSKDLTVAGYLSVGLVRERQINGLDEGVQVFRDLVDNYWDNLYPPKKRMRGRAGAFTWWLEKTAEVLENLNPEPIPAEQIQRLQENIRALDERLAEVMPEPPLLRPLQRQLERFPIQKSDAPETELVPEAAPQPAQAQAATIEQISTPAPVTRPSPVTETPAVVSSSQDAQKSIDAAFQRVRQACHYILQQDARNPSAYRYRRIAAWAGIDELPPNSDGVTQIPPPAPQVVEPLMELREAANWTALIENLEQKVSQFVFWFDLHYMVAEGLKNLGPDYTSALKAVCQETAYFLMRLPGVENLAFSDEMPFADARTLAWLGRIGVGTSGGDSGPERHSGAGQNERFNTMVQDAIALGRNKKVAEALDSLFRELQTAPSRSEQSRWRLGIAQVLLTIKKGPSALPHLEQIVNDIDTYQLEQWDPAFALEGLILAWKGFSIDERQKNQDLALDLLHRIARLNPVEALRLAP
jgi:type VI secretion system protein VasJ